MTPRPSWLLAALILVAAALVTVLALMRYAPVPPVACSDAYDPACAVPYEAEP